MKLADVSIKRPVFAVMLSAAIIVIGYASYRQLGLDLMPKTDFPMVVVRTSLPGASGVADYQAGRGGGQHHRRDRRTAVLFVPGNVHGHGDVRAGKKHRGCRAGCPR